MPRVPRIGEDRVDIARVPAARISPPTSAEAFGGGASFEAVGQAAQNLTKTGLKILAEQKKRADDLFVTEADARLSQIQTDIETEIYKMQGKNSLEAQDFAQKRWQEGVSEIEKGISNAEQRNRLKKQALKRWVSIYDKAQKHTVTQMDKYEKDLTFEYIKSEANHASLNYMDEQQIANSLQNIRLRLLDHANNTGMSDEQLFNTYDDVRSQLHGQVIRRALLDGQFEYADSYMDQFKDEMLDRDIGVVNNVRSEAQRLAAIERAEFERNYFVGVLNQEIGLLDARRDLEEGNIDVAFYKAIESRLLKMNNDPSIPLEEKVEVKNYLIERFLGLSDGPGQGVVDERGNVTVPVMDAQVEDVRRFRHEVAGFSPYLSENEERMFYQFTQMNSTAKFEMEAKKNLFERTVEWITNFAAFGQKFSPTGIILTPISDAAERMGIAAKIRAFGIFDPNKSVQDAQGEIDELKKDIINSGNEEFAQYPVGSMYPSIYGNLEVTGHDEFGFPIVKVPR